MEFGKRHDTTDTTDFCPRKLVTDLLRGNWCNGTWPYASCSATDILVFAQVTISTTVRPCHALLVCEW